MYSRAHLSRTVALVVAPSLTAVSTGAFAREFRAAKGDGLERSNVAVALIGTCVPAFTMSADAVAVLHHRTSAKGYISVGFEAATAGIHAKALHDPAAARLIERIRKME